MSDAMNGATDDSLRGDLAAALSGASEVTATPVDTSMEADNGIPGETQEEKAERLRDGKGRFAKTSDRADGKNLNNEGDPLTSEAQATEKDLQAQQAEQQSTNTRKAPQSWKPEVKAHFDTLPPEVQDEILRRETDFNKGIQKYAESAKFADTLRPVVDQWAPYLSQLQVSPDQAFQHLLATEHALRTGSPAQKQQMFMKLAQDYGVDLGLDPNAPKPEVDPNTQHALQRVQQLEAYIQNLEHTKRQEAARQQQAEQEALSQQIESFSSSPDVPHFETVRNDMAQLLQAGYATDLKDAYDKACWARPDIRASLLQKEEAKRIQERAELANKAKAKAVSVTGSPSGAAVPVVGASIRDDLRAAVEQAGGRL